MTNCNVDLHKRDNYANICKYKDNNTSITHHPVHMYLYRTIDNTYVIVKALPCVCTENTAQEGVLRGQYNTRQSGMLYLP